MTVEPTPETVERLWRIADAARTVAVPDSWDSVDAEILAWAALREALADLNATYPEPVDATR